MNKVIAFGGSNSKNSINKQLAVYAANQLTNTEVEVLDLNDFELPMYGIDYEMEYGIPENAQLFLDKIKSSNGIVLSLAEHNGAYASAFKNLFDWMSRIDGKLWSDIPMLLMATSPGARGGATVLEVAKGRFPYMGGNIVAEFSLPSFSENFSDEGLKNTDLQTKLSNQIKTFTAAING
ncbi:NADPH-dependent FMN reductase [Winogradskyella sp.]|jgi:NAD(P)H-dependent FMN reductase|uniref:NADPH-dependent FMN reductase n=1 Tax=Winogradskyella sp. TaxID=1883156 RepID=UPI0025E0BC12|nr:NAD(P)H-dependent oxidoreductase [Winogradskyella sp.]MCT4629628.1 NAD(P)H-dependent oxidoreductase [Winogradskyella sp.]